MAANTVRALFKCNVVQIMGECLRQSRALQRGGRAELEAQEGQLCQVEAEIGHMQRGKVAS